MRKIPSLCAAALLSLALAGCATPPARLHESLLTLDTHLDTPVFFGVEGWEFGDRHEYSDDGTQIDLPRMIEGGLDGGFFATFIPQGPLTDEGREAAKRAANKRLDEIYAMFAQYPGKIGIVRTSAEAHRLVARGQRFAFLSMENSYPMGVEPERGLAEFYARGVRLASPVHTQHNDLATSSTDIRAAAEPGLTELGRRWVREANRIGMLIDLSHSSDATLDDVLALSTKPIVLSHSGAKDVFRHPRNVDDVHLRRIAERGGVIQVAAFPDYLVEREQNPERAAAIAQIRRDAATQRTAQVRRDTVRKLAEVNQRWPVTPATFDQFMDHLLHVIRVAGIDHVGIGIDFDGGGGVEGLQDATQYPRITERLLKEGYSRNDLAKLWGGNLLRVLDQAQDVERL
ncbi:MAG: dipeptidase [Steroidobacteraceae bacterium]